MVTYCIDSARIGVETQKSLYKVYMPGQGSRQQGRVPFLVPSIDVAQILGKQGKKVRLTRHRYQMQGRITCVDESVA